MEMGLSGSVPHFGPYGVRVGRGRQQTKAVNQFPHFTTDDRVGFELLLAAECLGDRGVCMKNRESVRSML